MGTVLPDEDARARLPAVPAQHDPVHGKFAFVVMALRMQHMIANIFGKHRHTLAGALKLVHGHMSPRLYNKLNRFNNMHNAMKHSTEVEDDELLASLNQELHAYAAKKRLK